MQKIVFNGHYLMYFDTAVAGYWRAMAMPYHETMDYLGGDIFVRKATLEYLGSARYDDVLEVGVRCARIGNSSMVFGVRGVPRRPGAGQRRTGLRLRRPGHADAQPVPQELRDVLQAFEAGKPMVDVRVGELGANWAATRSASAPRSSSRSRDPGRDGVGRRRRGCVHAVAYNRFGMPLATGRLLEHVPGVAKIGRMAVLPVDARQRRRPRGARRVDAGARERGDREALLHAQTRAAPSTRGRASSRAGRCSKRPASRTSRWCARSERALQSSASKRSIVPRADSASVSKSGAQPLDAPAQRIDRCTLPFATVECVGLHQRDAGRRCTSGRRSTRATRPGCCSTQLALAGHGTAFGRSLRHCGSCTR